MLAMIQGLPPEPIVHGLPGNTALIVVVAVGHVLSMLLIGLAVLMALRYRAPLQEGPPVTSAPPDEGAGEGGHR